MERRQAKATRARRRPGAGCRALVAAVLLVLAPLAQALDPARTLAQLHHTAWSTRQGVPGDIWRMAQTTDGWLWLATPTGLFRFDGVRFERFRPRRGQALTANALSTVLATDDGDLWIGYLYGGASRLRHGELTHYLDTEGTGTTRALARDARGRTWAVMGRYLVHLVDGRWQRADPDLLPAGDIGSQSQDPTGALWVGVAGRLFRLPPDAERFVDSGIDVDGTTSVQVDPRGRRWLVNAQGIRPMPAPFDAPVARPPDPPSLALTSRSTLFDRDGAVWTAYCPNGVCRLPRAADTPVAQPYLGDGTDHKGAEQGLTADSGMTLMEDREGSIWVSTKLGLNRFRHANAVAVDLPSRSANFSLALDGEGGVWALAQQLSVQHLWRLDAATPTAMPGLPASLTTAHFDADGALWLGGRHRLWSRQGGALHEITQPWLQDNTVFQIAGDRDGHWLRLQYAGLVRHQDGRWTTTEEDGSPWGLPAKRPAVLVVDGANRAWFGFRDNRLAVRDAQGTRVYTADDGLAVGTVLAISAAQHVLVAGDLGFAAQVGERFRTLAAHDIEAMQGLTGVVERADGEVWLNGARGAVRIAADELQRAIADPAHRLAVERFDFEDGMPGVAQSWPYVPSLLAAPDGRLWFATTGGVAWIDPARLLRNPVPPPVAVLGLLADDQPVPVVDGLVLPAGTRRLHIDYTALSLRVPARTRFRYRLSGIDTDWQDAGDRRTAIYTNVGPGAYRFDLAASNDSGVWNTDAAGLDFSIRPAFVQTGWFYGLLAAALALLLWQGYRWRMRQVSAQIRDRLGERVAERERIARELHDTLLQGFQGLLLRLQAGVARLAPEDPARQALEQTLDRADEVLVEGRDRVRDLRSRHDEDQDLVELVEAAAADVRADLPGVACSVQVLGRPRRLDPIARDDLHCIVREALANAVHHAHASRIDVVLEFRRASLDVSVRDDGVGIDAAVLAAGGRPGHWGLAGMRERAGRLGTVLQVSRRAEGGTELQLRVPSRIAFTDCLWRSGGHAAVAP